MKVNPKSQVQSPKLATATCAVRGALLSGQKRLGKFDRRTFRITS